MILEKTIKNLIRALDTNFLVRDELLVRRERERENKKIRIVLLNMIVLTELQNMFIYIQLTYILSNKS